ncbi:MAG TPA: hypothetical protein ENK23_07700 [Sorangium sp.]|nr:hypothetical protein [Sorangium sp.]
MRFKRFTVFAIGAGALTLTACKDSPKERLEGRWVGEAVENFRPEQTAQAAGWAKGTSFEFKGSRVTVSIPAESARSGTYKVTARSERELQVTFLRAHGAKDVVDVQFEDDDRLRWKLGDGRSVLMRKVP